MSAHHCEKHDRDATNGCPVCTRCRFCGREDGRVEITSSAGIDAWNILHPDEQVTSLFVCDESCNHALGVRNGNALATLALARRVSQKT